MTSITIAARIVTKSVSRCDILRSFATAIVISMAGPVAAAHPLEDAAQEAARLCAAAGSESIEACITSAGGRSSESARARRAALAFYKQLTDFYDACDQRKTMRCHIEAEWLSYSGMSRAIEATAHPSPRSDTTR